MKQTAVQRLIEQLRFTHKEAYNDLYEVIQLAKAMEREQIVEAHFTSSGCNSFDIEESRVNSAYKAAQQYYKETYED